MFGLAEEIGGNQLCVGGFVGDYGDFRRARQQVDTDSSEQLPLGLGDVGVAGTDQYVRRLFLQEPEGHGGHGLHTPEGEGPVHAGQIRGIEHGGVASPSGPAGGVQATTLRTPAALATPTVIKALARMGNLPAGRYAPTRPTGTYFWPTKTPGMQLDFKIAEVFALLHRK